MSYVSWILDQSVKQYCIETSKQGSTILWWNIKDQDLRTVNIMGSLRNNTERLNFYIVYIDQTSLLFAGACEKLELLTVNIVNSVENTNFDLTHSQLLYRVMCLTD